VRRALLLDRREEVDHERRRGAPLEREAAARGPSSRARSPLLPPAKKRRPFSIRIALPKSPSPKSSPSAASSNL
jgi:hypothetical protein